MNVTDGQTMTYSERSLKINGIRPNDKRISPEVGMGFKAV